MIQSSMPTPGEGGWRSRLLFSDALAPITSEIGFLKADLEDVLTAFVMWTRSVVRDVMRDRRGEVVATQITTTTLREAIDNLLPLRTIRPNRYLFIRTRGPWIAYFDNGARGTDVFPVVSYLASVLRCDGARVVAVPDTARASAQDGGRFGALMLDVYGPTQPDDPLNIVRSVGVLNDGGRWRFNDDGERLPFEQPASYDRRAVRERFTFDLLEQYCSAMGLSLFDETFYARDAAVVEIRSVVPKHARDLQLSEVQRTIGLGS